MRLNPSCRKLSNDMLIDIFIPPYTDTVMTSTELTSFVRNFLRSSSNDWHSIYNAEEPSPKDICLSFAYVRKAAKCGKTDFEFENRFGKRKPFSTGLYMIENDRTIRNLSANL